MAVYYSKPRRSWFICYSWQGKRYYCYSSPSGVFVTKQSARDYEPLFVASLSGKVAAKEISCDSLFSVFEGSLSERLKPQSVYSRIRYFRKYVSPNFSGFMVSSLSNVFLASLNHQLNCVPQGSVAGVISTAKLWVRFLVFYCPSLSADRLFKYSSYYPKTHVYTVWPLDQEKRFLSVIEDPRDKLLFSLLVYYGLRISECLALKWSDFKDGCFRVSRIVCIKTTAKKQIFTTPKTARSVRVLPVVDAVKPLLKDRETGWLFPGSFGAPTLGETSVRRLNKEYAAKAGLKALRLHEFRHSCASNLLRAKVSVRLVARWLGDTETTLLNTYSHLFPDEDNEIFDFFRAESSEKPPK